MFTPNRQYTKWSWCKFPHPPPHWQWICHAELIDFIPQISSGVYYSSRYLIPQARGVRCKSICAVNRAAGPLWDPFEYGLCHHTLFGVFSLQVSCVQPELQVPLCPYKKTNLRGPSLWPSWRWSSIANGLHLPCLDTFQQTHLLVAILCALCLQLYHSQFHVRDRR